MLRNFFSDNKPTSIDDEIAEVREEMRHVGVTSDEYPKLMTYLERLNKLKMQERPEPVSRDTIVIVVGNLLGILVIVAYERTHVTISKAFGQLIRLKGSQ